MASQGEDLVRELHWSDNLRMKSLQMHRLQTLLENSTNELRRCPGSSHLKPARFRTRSVATHPTAQTIPHVTLHASPRQCVNRVCHPGFDTDDACFQHQAQRFCVRYRARCDL